MTAAGIDISRDGFVILQGCRSPHRSVQLKRIVLARERQGRGLGRTCVCCLTFMAFRDLKTHRFWLDVTALDTRALALYATRAKASSRRADCARACASRAGARRPAATRSSC